jgi:hypothetical protein
VKKSLEVEVCTATQCSFIPFTVVPDGWAGRKVRIELVEDEAEAVSPKTGSQSRGYDQGFKDGYERRHMEVLAALA